jgi:hypothetical protein
MIMLRLKTQEEMEVPLKRDSVWKQLPHPFIRIMQGLSLIVLSKMKPSTLKEIMTRRAL